MAEQQNRNRPKLAPATVSPGAAAALDDIAGAYYGGKKSRAIDAALLSWVTVVSDPATHGLASKPGEALAAYCAARDVRPMEHSGRDASQGVKADKAPKGTTRSASLTPRKGRS